MATEPVPSAQSHSPALRRRRTNTGGATPPGPGVRPAWAQVHSLYQPVVHLQTRTVIGYEALARGPEGTDLYTPDALFAAARARGTFGELDWACRIAAFDGAVKAHLPSTLELFVNVEAAALNAPPPPGAAAALSAAGGLSVVIELTERDLTGDVAGLLRAVERARAQGWRVALDDVGAAPASLALLPFLRPEIIKLDLSLLHTTTNTATVEILTAVTAEAARTGATLLAEGIETEDHAQLAVRMGARLGQGWLFGRPAPLPTFPMRAPPPSRPRPLINVASRVLEAPPAARTTTLGTPYSVVVASANTANTANTAKGAQRVATKRCCTQSAHSSNAEPSPKDTASSCSALFNMPATSPVPPHSATAISPSTAPTLPRSPPTSPPTPCPVLTALPCPRTTRWSGSGASSSSPRCSPEP